MHLLSYDDNETINDDDDGTNDNQQNVIHYIQRQLNQDKQVKIIDAIKWICKFMKQNDLLYKLSIILKIWEYSCDHC